MAEVIPPKKLVNDSGQMKSLLYNGLYFKLEEDTSTGIILITFTQGLSITLKIAHEIVAERMKLINKNNERLILVDVIGTSSIDDNARTYWASKEAFQGIKAVGIVTNKKWQVMIVNFFIQFNKPPAPTRLFTELGQAKKWLLKFEQPAT